jgi:hypothetical protein
MIKAIAFVFVGFVIGFIVGSEAMKAKSYEEASSISMPGMSFANGVKHL